MTTSPTAARARLRSADPMPTLPVPDPQDVAARAMLERILVERPTVAPGRPLSRRLAMAGVVATAAAAMVTVGVVATPWSQGRPGSAAYAVTESGDGAVSVTVHWDELHDPAALNAELARLGARTVVMVRSADGQCRRGFVTDPAHSVMQIDLDEHPDLRDPARFLDYLRAQSPWIDQTAGWEDGAVFTIHPDKIPAGDTLLIPYELVPNDPAHPGGPEMGLITSMLVRDVPACVPSRSDSVYTTTGIEVR